MSDTQAWMITDDVANQVLQRGFVADEYQLEIAVPGERSGCRTTTSAPRSPLIASREIIEYALTGRQVGRRQT